MQNVTRSNLNQTINWKDLFLANLLTTSFSGGTQSTYIIVPFSSLGTIFNAISLLIFFKKSFRTIALFKYMKIYTLTSLIINSTLIFAFFFNVSQLFDLAISYSARIYRCFILPSYVVTFFFFYGNVIDIFINIERAVNFSNKYQWFKNTSPYIICLATLIVCVFINLPNYFLYDLVQDKDLYLKLRLCVPSSFIQTPLGRITQLVSYVIQGPVVLILVVLSNILSLISFRNYLNRKKQTIRKPKIVDKLQQRRQRKLEKMDKKLLWMTFYLTGYSVIMHFIQFASQIIIFYIGTSPILISVFTFLFAFIMSLKHCTNIFFYYFFNINFRKAINVCKLNQSSEETLAATSSNTEKTLKSNNRV